MRKNVLIYPGNAYPAEQCYFCLRYSLRYKPIIGNHGHAHFELITEDGYSDFPLITDENFFDFINRFISEKDISFIIPTHDTVADFLAQNQDKLNAVVVCSDGYTAHVCRHKRETYALFSKYDFIPRVYNLNGKIEYPVFAKDDVGQGGKSAGIIRSREEVDRLLQQSSIDYILTEFLPGEEITVDCFTNRKHELLMSIPRHRETILTGMCGRARRIPLTDEIKLIADTINGTLNFRGYWYFQCKKDANGKFKLMEISTRIPGTFTLTKNLDINLPLLALTDFDGLDVTIAPNDYDIIADRGYVIRFKPDIRYDRVYLDFDDTLVSNRETLILPTVTFLFQCLNRKKEVILLTRHAYDIMETLDHIHLDPRLFDRIIEVKDGTNKTDYIKTDKPCIFVDNAFAERLSVKQRLGIPTFDVCNLDCLLEAIY